MVARPSVARARLPLYFEESLFIYLFIFSRHTFSDVGKPTSLKLSHTTWLSIQQNLAIPISSKCPQKRTGPKNPKFGPFLCEVANN